MTPHCDQKVLHAPGECQICDTYAPDAQKYRQWWGICFTGHKPDGVETMILCPSEWGRNLETINLWPGNRPQEFSVASGSSMSMLDELFGEAVVASGNAIDDMLDKSIKAMTCITHHLTWRERLIALFTGEFISER